MALCDIARSYDPAARRCDDVFDGTDLVLDFTAVAPVLLCLGLDRRAHGDDVLPGGPGDMWAPGTIDPKRGWCGDFLDPRGRLSGSRLWLLEGAKQTEATRRLAETAIGEALKDFAAASGIAMDVLVRWQARGFLAWRVIAGGTPIEQTMPVAA